MPKSSKVGKTLFSAIFLCPKTDIGQTEAVNEKSYAVKFDYTIYNKPFLFKFRHSKFSTVYMPKNGRFSWFSGPEGTK